MSDTEREIQTLQQKVEEAENALQKAAQYGLQLLDDKIDIQNKLEEQRIEMTAVIEVSVRLALYNIRFDERTMIQGSPCLFTKTIPDLILLALPWHCFVIEKSGCYLWFRSITENIWNIMK